MGCSRLWTRMGGKTAVWQGQNNELKTHTLPSLNGGFLYFKTKDKKNNRSEVMRS